MKGDFTRDTFDPKKHYSSVRMQQGRVQLDADWNEQVEIGEHLRETALRDVVGPCGVPKEGGGFEVVASPDGGDLLLTSGRIYVDGILCELGPEPEVAIFPPAGDVLGDPALAYFAGVDLDEVKAVGLAVDDWLEVLSQNFVTASTQSAFARLEEIDATQDRLRLSVPLVTTRIVGNFRIRRASTYRRQGDLPGTALPAAGAYLVYLDVWQRHLTALEDPEIREVALGGPDTATRVRTVCQVKLLGLDPRDEPFRCSGRLIGWQEATAPSTGKLRAHTLEGAGVTNPCVVPAEAGYTRLENQLYRVEIHRGGDPFDSTQPPTFKWSRDNGTVVTDWLEQDGTKLMVRSAGRDRVLGLAPGDVVEVTDDDHELRGEPGRLFKLEDVRGDVLTIVLPPGESLAIGDYPNHPKVRRWDLDSADGAQVEVSTNGEVWLPLESGIEVRFEPGTYRTGDYWLIPARAFVGKLAGEIEWPRGAGGRPLAMPPHGIEHHYCRLALVRREILPDGSPGLEVLADCRPCFYPLTELRCGCCTTATVGDGVHSQGDFRRVQEAVDALPAAGGEVRVLSGTYEEHVEIRNRDHVKICGCGPRSVLRAAQEVFAEDLNSDGVITPDETVTFGEDRPVIHVVDSDDVTICSLDVEAFEGVGVEVATEQREAAAGVHLLDLGIRPRDRAAVVGRRLAGFRLADCRIGYSAQDIGFYFRDAGGSRREPAVFLHGEDLAIEDNEIRVDDTSDDSPGFAPGGLQIAGGSERVEIRGNTIRGGTGNAVTLGSVSRTTTLLHFDFANVTFFERDTGVDLEGPGVEEATTYFASWNALPLPQPIDRFNDGLVLVDGLTIDDGGRLVSDGAVSDVRIAGNELTGMGGNGIAAAHFFPLAGEQADAVTVKRLTVDDNRIERCVRLPIVRSPDLADLAANGGIVLADGEVITLRDNFIQDNGAGRFEPVCGIFILQARRGVDLKCNRILRNGRTLTPDDATVPGARGGIVIASAVHDPSSRRQDGMPALRVVDNVVDAPEGRALQATVSGPTVVHGNQLTTSGILSLAVRGSDLPGGPTDFVYGLAETGALDVSSRSNFRSAVFQAVVGGVVVSLVNQGVPSGIWAQLVGFNGLGTLNTAPFFSREISTGDFIRGYAGGNVQFHDNQVVLQVAEGGEIANPFSAVYISTLDDASMAGNQCECDLGPGRVGVDAVVLGTTVRVVDNRFKERPSGAFHSATTFGFANNTSNNQGTHCFAVTGTLRVAQGNSVLLEGLTGNYRCQTTFGNVNDVLKAAIRFDVF